MTEQKAYLVVWFDPILLKIVGAGVYSEPYPTVPGISFIYLEATGPTYEDAREHLFNQTNVDSKHAWVRSLLSPRRSASRKSAASEKLLTLLDDWLLDDWHRNTED